MVARITHLGTRRDGSLGAPMPRVSIAIDGDSEGGRVVLLEHALGMLYGFEQDGTGLFLRPVDGGGLPGSRVVLDLPGQPGAGVWTWALDQALTDSEGGRAGAVRAFLSDGAKPGDAAMVAGLRDAAGPLIFAAASDGQGVGVFRRTTDGALDPVDFEADSATLALSNVAALAVVPTGRDTFLYTGSASESGVTGFRVEDDGALTPVQGLGPEQGLPVSAITAMSLVLVEGDPYLLVAAAGSSSLTVLRVAPDGGLTMVDHALDTLDSRFGQITRMAVVHGDDRSFVVLAGADDGLTLLALLPGGRLVHLDSLADSTDWALANVSALEAAWRDGGIDIFATSGADPGLSQFRVDLSDLGAMGGLIGGPGDDILIDGAGSDTLHGGAGRDIFVLAGDGTRNRIDDAVPGEDLVDLSDWAFFHGAAQLSVASRSWGARVTFRDESLDIHTRDDIRLSDDDVARLVVTGINRFAVDARSVPIVPGLVDEGGAGDDSLVGRAGDDFFRGLGGDDTLRGDMGHDSLVGGDGDDLLVGDAGNDNMAAGNGNDTIIGRAGNDSMGGGFGDDALSGGDGSDYGGGGPGHDSILGGTGNDYLSAGWGRDTLHGQDGQDWLAGSYDADTVTGGAGDDTIGGGTGNDTIDGGNGDDNIGAGDDDDRVTGGSGNDFLGGGAGADRLDGGPGRDTLNGGYGDDTLVGGAGADVFVFNALFGDGQNTITDFEDGTDLLRLVGLHPGPAGGRMDFVDLRETLAGDAPATLLDYGDYRISLRDIRVDDITEDDFLFL
jgi:Ca2+-binding RTX toxin-like protein